MAVQLAVPAISLVARPMHLAYVVQAATCAQAGAHALGLYGRIEKEHAAAMPAQLLSIWNLRANLGLVTVEVQADSELPSPVLAVLWDNVVVGFSAKSQPTVAWASWAALRIRLLSVPGQSCPAKPDNDEGRPAEDDLAARRNAMARSASAPVTMLIRQRSSGLVPLHGGPLPGQPPAGLPQVGIGCTSLSVVARALHMPHS